jgi:hypothetical protein
MVLKFDLVMSREFSGMRRQELVRPANRKFRVSTTPRGFEFKKRSQFFVRGHNEASIRVTNERR